MIRKTGHFGRVPVVIAILTAGLGFCKLNLGDGCWRVFWHSRHQFSLLALLGRYTPRRKRITLGSAKERRKSSLALALVAASGGLHFSQMNENE
jgi:hypothetical protein